MNLLSAALLFVAAFGLLLAGATRIGVWRIEKANPPAGEFTEVRGTKMHFAHVEAGDAPDLPPVVFLHGASGNLNDQMVPLGPVLKGRAELLFVDRPGHGWSERGPEDNVTPAGQADTLAALMEARGIDRAIIAGHSFGSAVVATFALRHPDKTAGLVFVAPATHPWPGGGTSWYYALTATPVIGWLFSETLAWPGGTLRAKAGARCVFAPNKMPDDYVESAGIPLVLRPKAFRANARDVDGLYDYVVEHAGNYRNIKAPTVVISGTRDTVVYEEVHSVGLGRDIAGSELVWVKNLGHKPDWVARELVVGAIEKVAGRPVDLQALAAELEKQIADDAFGPIERCPDEKPDFGAEGAAARG